MVGSSHGVHVVSISVTDISPDYQKSRDAEFDFTPYSSRYMSVKTIYCVGGKILSMHFDLS